ncbi:hypothetical protein RJZ56_005386 [Blastomyces dermatitidis]|uniref:SET domain-containing protein n=1 Tax=Blastomyces gilchristii (strain SLH14081) TaxID=559298 RepID=A0A179UP12_BLAGS|nr:SET domain-containing protein [Blastomyces gilchristii SLH14081]XP_031578899.1 SET domain-containing protein, variant [Blastomyces gilchristii SLH14081]OAT09573.1 SET domain-containing protein [Blastomyces gilchristii SLH14081]OAT09574.1 SET domain-containing protein, variant [Blastomyces gilchristii SLH14081]
MVSLGKPSWMTRRSKNRATVSLEIKAQALLIMEQIYLDIHLASLESQNNSSEHMSTNPNTFAATASRTLSSVGEAMMNEDAPRDLQLQRFIDLGKSLSWMILGICSHSTHFIAAAAAGDGDGDELWKELYTLIRSNDISIELFAEVRCLSWSLADPIAARLDKGGKLGVEEQDTYPYVIDLAQKAIYHPKHFTRRQENITRSRFFRDVFDPSENLRRQPGDGNCAICTSPQICECQLELAEEKHPLLELREYPDRGIGVRSLRSIKAGTFIGEYVGEIRDPAYRLGSTYGLHHTLHGRSIGVIDAAVYGNWTRYMNHSCRAGVVFVSTVVGDRACVLVRAIRDIEMFEEITVDYGDEYFMPRHRVCKCGEEVCRFKEGGGSGMERAVEEVGGYHTLYKSLSAAQRYL